jgi:hypothetical protein
MKERLMDLIPGLIGGVMGGIVGYFIYKWGLQQNLKAGVIPGAFVGLGSGLVSSRRSPLRGLICGLAALALGLYAEWRYFPFVADGSLGYFLAHVYQLNALVIIMIVLGTILGFWWGGDGFKPSFAGRPASSEEVGRRSS